MVVDDDARAFTCEGTRAGGADPARGARDEHTLAGEPCVHARADMVSRERANLDPGAGGERVSLRPAPLGQPHPLIDAGVRAEEQSQRSDQHEEDDECDCHTLSIGVFFDKHKSSYHSC